MQKIHLKLDFRNLIDDWKTDNFGYRGVASDSEFVEEVAAVKETSHH